MRVFWDVVQVGLVGVGIFTLWYFILLLISN